MVFFIPHALSFLKRVEEHPAQTLRFLHRDVTKRLYWKCTAVEREELIALITQKTKLRNITELLEELKYSKFLQELTEKTSPFLTKVKTQKGWISHGLITDHGIGDFGAVLYVIVRLLKPQRVVETGVANGASSAFILEAMEMNNQGHLYSIDLPPKKGEFFDDGASYIIPQGKKVGWLVPKSLQPRWTLVLEPAEKSLAPLLQNLGTVDVFLHDSLHTYNHMMFEYSTVWPHLRTGGVLLSDDLFTYRNALVDFANRVSRPLIHYYTLGSIIK